jgi:hypothetical protein
VRFVIWFVCGYLLLMVLFGYLGHRWESELRIPLSRGQAAFTVLFIAVCWPIAVVTALWMTLEDGAWKRRRDASGGKGLPRGAAKRARAKDRQQSQQQNQQQARNL